MTAAAPRRRRDGELAQGRILEEAMTAIAEQGLSGLTMSGLAQRLGISGGHILYYFGTKDRLLLDTLRHSEDLLAAQRRELLGRRSTAPRRLDAFLALYLPTGRRDPRWMLWLELWARTTGNPELRRAQEEIDAGWRADLAELLARGARSGRFGLAEEEIASVADELLTFLDGLSVRVALGLDGATPELALASAHRAASRLTGGGA